MTASRDLPAGTEVRLGFPHWVYGSRGEPPPGAERHGFGRWYVVRRLPARLPAGGTWDFRVDGLRLPQAAGPWFAPEVVVAILNVGSEMTNINIVQAGVPYFTKDLQVGGNTFVEAVQRNLDAGIYEWGRLSPRHENGVAAFQKSIREAIA